MKKLLILSLMLVTVFSLNAQKQKMQSDLEENDGIFYLKKTGEKYTGVAYSYHKNGKRKKQTTYKKGKVTFETMYHENGDIASEVAYKKGKRHGTFTAFYKGKKLKAEGKYKKGKKTGDWTWYNEDGSVKEQKSF